MTTWEWERVPGQRGTGHRHGPYFVRPVPARGRGNRRLKQSVYVLTLAGLALGRPFAKAATARAFAEAFDALDKADRRAFLRNGAEWCFQYEQAKRVDRVHGVR